VRLKFLGACGEIGRSGILVENGGAESGHTPREGRLVLDYGIKPTTPPEFPLPVEAGSVVVSHAHLDHSGTVPNLSDMRPVVYMTPPTLDVAHMLVRDTLKVSKKRGVDPPFRREDVQRFREIVRTVPYRKPFPAAGTEVTLYSANHIPGSAATHVNGHRTLLYTGDNTSTPTRLVPDTETKYPEADALIMECTYFGTEHKPRFDLELEFVESVLQTLEEGGHAVIPCFGVARWQEMLLVLANYGIHPWVDGMGFDIARMLLNHPAYARARDLRAALEKARRVEPEERARVLEEPAAVITTAGMMEGGPVLYYVQKLKDHEKSRIFLTGYQIQGTNGRKAVEGGYIDVRGETVPLKMGVSLFNFSSHSGDSQLKGLAKEFADRGTRKLFAVHGEKCAEFAEWARTELGVEAEAPARGEEFEI
jgi:putative mRNA 3-end processing factor